MRFNINKNVKVRLKDVGLIELERQYKDAGIEFTPPKVDDDGYSTWQLWDLMSTFGAVMSVGHRTPFEMEIIIPEDVNTWNTEPPSNCRDVLIRGNCDDHLVAHYNEYNEWIPSNVECDYDMAGIEHDLDEPIVWQELPK